MEEKLCNQAGAYPSRVATEFASDAVCVYEQLKEAIESVEKVLSDEEQLLVLWHDATTITMEISHIGYFGQTFLVFIGRDAKAIESTALVPIHLAQVLLKTAPRKPGETFQPINFIGHSVKPCG